MGIRFACHACEQHLNIKRELAGRRGVCPSCGVRFRIPLEDTNRSTPLDDQSSSSVIGVVDQAEPPDSPGPVRPPSSAERNAATTTILDLDQEQDGTWYVRPPSGGQYGPATTLLLKQWIDEGRVAATALLWRDGWPQWRDASEALPELIAKLPGNGGTGNHPPAPNPVRADRQTAGRKPRRSKLRS